MNIKSTILLLLFVFGVGVAQAQQPVPPAPKEFGYQTKQTATNKWSVMLYWLRGESDDSLRYTQGFNIYRANKKTEDIALFTKIGSVLEPIPGTTKYTFTDGNVAPGEYTYFVRAFNSNGESERTTIKVVTLKENSQETKFEFKSSPVTSAKAGSEYYYDANAEHSSLPSGSTIVYGKMYGPDGLTVNERTGEVTWNVPDNASGVYEVKIKAWVSSKPDQIIYQYWSIKIGDGSGSNSGEKKTCGIITGTLLQDNGAVVTSGYVIAYVSKRSDDTNSPTKYVGMYKAKIENGRFELAVAAGEYAIFTEGESYFPRWYANATNANDAQKINVQCNDTIAITMLVERRPEEKFFVYSGRVINSANDEGIQASVTFYKLLQNTSTDKLAEGITVKTNANGEYEAKLSSRWNYIAYAKAFSQDFNTQYFELVQTPSQATILTPTANRNNVNFALTQRPQYNNSISGRMIDSAGNGVKGTVVAVLITTNGNEQEKEKYRSVETDDQGSYTISNLKPGEYIVLGIPNTRTNAAGYYKESTFAVSEWKEATKLNVTETSATTNIQIQLSPITGKKGIIKVGGSIKEKGGIAGKSGGIIQAQSAIPGALVTIRDEQNKIVDCVFSGTSGTYTIPEVGFGAITIVADHPDFASTKQLLTLNTLQTQVSADMQLQRIGVTSVEETNTNSLQATPNPASSQVSISIEAHKPATIEIVNANGVLVLQSNIELATSNAVTLNTSELANGVYTIRLTQLNKVATTQLVVIR